MLSSPCTAQRGAPASCGAARGGAFLFERHGLRPRAWRRHGVRVEAAAASVDEELSDEKRDLQRLLSKPYKYGFKTIIESDVFPKGLSEDVVRAISAKKGEPEWMLDFRCGRRARAGGRPAAAAATGPSLGV